MSKFTDEIHDLCKQYGLERLGHRNENYQEFTMSVKSDPSEPMYSNYKKLTAIGLRIGKAIVYFFNMEIRRYTDNIDELKYMMNVFMKSCKMYNDSMFAIAKMRCEHCPYEEIVQFKTESLLKIQNFEERMMRLYELDRS